MNKLLKYSIIPIIILIFGSGISYKIYATNSNNHKTIQESQQSSATQTTAIKKAHLSMRTPIDYREPSETIPYPKSLKKSDQVVVNLQKQRVYILRNNKKIYEMYASSGTNNKTPIGNYKIQSERGKYFYSPTLKEGAQYWVSWKDHGVYLFHATPTDENKKIIKSDAEKLGKQPSSHGCIHLSIPDAKWFSKNAKVGMTVKIINK